MYDFVRGPLMWIAFIVFIGGIIFRIFQVLRVTKKKDWLSFPSAWKKKEVASDYSVEEQKMQWVVSFKNSLLGTYPTIAIVTSIFHFCLFVIPIFLLAHNLFLYESWKIRIWALPESVTDFLTIIFITCALFFFVRRLVVPQVRAITTFYDYILLFIATAPFLTGFFAYHQYFDYKTILTLHILFGEIMLMAITFTKLGHMAFFFIIRFLVESEYCLGQGTRVWKPNQAINNSTF